MILRKERALLIGVNINHQFHFQESMEELKNLAVACDLKVVGQAEQNLKLPNSVFFIGSGKVDEMKSLAAQCKPDVFIFNGELSPSQLRNLARRLEGKIMDRTSLILEIFARRAKTKEAKLQVEMAHLQYMLPRLIGLKESLEQQTGGVGTTTRGPGEKTLELDRRKIETKISELNKELEFIARKRQTQRKKRKRSELPTVALVGYTNSGKSTLMNAMIEHFQKSENKKVFEDDLFFATLETAIRSITLPDSSSFLLMDTVGFISQLPHHLVKAFRSTLDEVSHADLLLHVIDISNPDSDQQIVITEETLKQIGAAEIPTIHVYNKVDLTTLQISEMNHHNRVYISARNRIGLDELVKQISQSLFKQYVYCKMLIPYHEGSLLSYLNENACIKAVRYHREGTLLTLKCRESDYQRYNQFLYTGNICLKTES